MAELSRREFLETVGELVGLAAVVHGCSSLEKDSPEKYLGERWNDLTYKTRSKVREEWRKYDDDLKELIYHTYNDSEDVYNSLSQEGREQVEKILEELRNNTSFEGLKAYTEIKEISDHFPWINLEEPTKQDAVLIREIGGAIGYGIIMAQ